MMSLKLSEDLIQLLLKMKINGYTLKDQLLEEKCTSWVKMS